MVLPRTLSEGVTITQSVSVTGKGLHSGEKIKVTLTPSKESNGITFVKHQENTAGIINPELNNVSDTLLCTEISNGDFKIATVEHLLSCLYALQVKDLVVHVYGDEIPIFDGSSADWFKILLKAGLFNLTQLKKGAVNAIEKPFYFKGRTGEYEFLPSSKEELIIDAAYQPVGKKKFWQKYRYEHTPTNYISKIVDSQTFCFEEDVNQLRAMGKIKGGTIENALVLGKKDIINPDERVDGTELVRHKILDFLGDMSLIGFLPAGRIKIKNPNHTDNLACFKAWTSQL